MHQHNPHQLNTDSDRNTKNIKIIKTAVENANLCEKMCEMRTLLQYAENAAQCEIRGNRIYVG